MDRVLSFGIRELIIMQKIFQSSARAAMLIASLSTVAYAQTAATLQPPAAQQNPQLVQQTRQLLDWLGVLALLDQTSTTLTNSLEAEAKFRQATQQQREGWRRELEPKLKSTALQQALIRYVADRYRPETFQRADELLQQPLAKRARFFDLAMTQPTAAPGLRDYRAQLQTAPQANRRAVAQELDAAMATSLLTAILQTCIASRVQQVADGAVQAQCPVQEFVERQRFLEPFTEDYLLYAYRYFNDDELAAYRDLMRDAQLQWLLDVARQGLIAVLQDAK